MELTFSDERVVELAKRLAAITGETLDAAVLQAIRERLAVIEHENSKEARSARVLSLIAEMQERMPKEFKEADFDALLYDHLGLPTK